MSEKPDRFGFKTNHPAWANFFWPGSLKELSGPIAGAFLAYWNKQLPKPGKHNLYLNRGDKTLDSFYEQDQHAALLLLAKQDWKPPYLKARFFAGAGHSERAWAARPEEPIRFLFRR